METQNQAGYLAYPRPVYEALLVSPSHCRFSCPYGGTTGQCKLGIGGPVQVDGREYIQCVRAS